MNAICLEDNELQIPLPPTPWTTTTVLQCPSSNLPAGRAAWACEGAGFLPSQTVSHTKSLGAGMPWQKGMLCDWQPVLSGFQCHVSQILIDLQPHQEEFCPFLCYIKLDSPRAQGLWSSLVLRLGVSESISKADSVQETERKDDNCEPSLLCIFPLEAAQW